MKKKVIYLCLLILISCNITVLAQRNKVYTSLEEALKNPDEVYVLNLQEQNLSTIPNGLIKLTHLKELDLSNNHISIIPDFLCDLTEIEALNLANNKIQKIPSSFKRLNKIIALNLENNKIQNIDNLYNCGDLELINLRNNKLVNIEENIKNLKQLQVLGLDVNNIISIPEAIDNLEQLNFLGLADNKLKSLPRSMARLQNLKKIQLFGNPFETIPQELFPWLYKHGNGGSEKITRIAGKHNQNKLFEAQNNRLELELRQRSLEAENLKKQTQNVKIKAERDSLNNLAKQRIQETNLLKEREKLTSLEKAKAKLEKAKLEAEKNEIKSKQVIQKYILWAVILLLVIAVFFVFYVNKFNQKEKKSRNKITKQKEQLEQILNNNNTLVEELTKKNQELEALAEELRQQSDTVTAQRNDLQEKTHELEALAEELRQQSDTVTAQRDELQKKTQKLEELQNTKDLMISAVNHDLRNPLNPILNYSQADYPDDPVKRLAMVNERAKAMFGLINDIMDIYRADKLQVRVSPNSPHKAVAEAITAISEAKNNLPSILNEVDEEIMGIFEYKYIERVFENLLSNAVKYSDSAEEGGEVRFWSSPPSPKGGESNPLASEGETKMKTPPLGDGGLVRLGITDNGMGIPEDKFREIFEPFTNPNAQNIGAAKSVGMGLTFCKTIIEAHKSEIHVESEVGKGTTFWFELPVYMAEKEKVETEIKINENFELSTENKEYLIAFVNRMKGYELYETSELTEVLSEIQSEDPHILGWKQAVEKTIDEYEEEEYQILMTMD